jgi:hypothetical protein
VSFKKIGSGKGVFLFKGVNESFSDFLHFLPICIKACVQMLKKMYLAIVSFKIGAVKTINFLGV